MKSEPLPTVSHAPGHIKVAHTFRCGFRVVDSIKKTAWLGADQRRLLAEMKRSAEQDHRDHHKEEGTRCLARPSGPTPGATSTTPAT